VVLQVSYFWTQFPEAEALGAGALLVDPARMGLVTTEVLTQVGQATVKVVAEVTVMVLLLMVTTVGEGQ
jgi:hypothetical protein